MSRKERFTKIIVLDFCWQPGCQTNSCPIAFALPTHPGEILLGEFLKPLGISQVAFAKHVGVPLQRINEIIHGKRGISPDTAWRFSLALGTTPEFWMNLQARYDLARSRPKYSLERIDSTSKSL